MLQSKEPVIYEYVSLTHISRYVVAAAIAHEDQQIGPRTGAFDSGTHGAGRSTGAANRTPAVHHSSSC